MKVKPMYDVVKLYVYLNNEPSHRCIILSFELHENCILITQFYISRYQIPNFLEEFFLSFKIKDTDVLVVKNLLLTNRTVISDFTNKRDDSYLIKNINLIINKVFSNMY